MEPLKHVIPLHQIRWIPPFSICVIGLLSFCVSGNTLPLLVVFFAVYFLLAMLVKESQSGSLIFVKRFVVATLFLTVALGTFNYLVNPFGLYPPRLFEPIVLTTRNYKMNLYAAYSPPPQALILGSSRSFTVDPDQIQHLWQYSTFNASVTGGRMQDSLAFLRYVSQVGALPKLLIIELTPRQFKVTDDALLQEPDARLWDFVDHQDPAYFLKVNFNRVTRLLSLEQTQLSLRQLQIEMSGEPVSYVYQAYQFDVNGMGHFNSPPLSPEVLDPVNLAATSWATQYAQYQPDTYQFDTLRQILEVAKSHNILVIGYIIPFHPALQKVMLNQVAFAPTLNLVLNQFDAFAQNYPFHYINFINSGLFPVSDDMFYDLVHPTPQASAMMMQQLYDQFHSYRQS